MPWDPSPAQNRLDFVSTRCLQNLPIGNLQGTSISQPMLSTDKEWMNSANEHVMGQANLTCRAARSMRGSRVPLKATSDRRARTTLVSPDCPSTTPCPCTDDSISACVLHALSFGMSLPQSTMASSCPRFDNKSCKVYLAFSRISRLKHIEAELIGAQQSSV